MNKKDNQKLKMKSKTKQILNQIIQEEYNFLNTFPETFYFYYVEGNFVDKYSHELVLNRDLLFNLYHKLKYNFLSDDLLNLQLTFAFNDEGKYSKKVIVVKFFFFRNSIKKSFKLDKIVTSVVKHKPIALFEQSNKIKYFCLKNNSKYFTVNNIKKIAFETINKCLSEKGNKH